MEDAIEVNEVAKLIGRKSRMTIWRYMKDPGKQFPLPTYDLGTGRNVWSRADVLAWLERRRDGSRRYAYGVTERNTEVVERMVEQKLRVL